MPKRERIHKAGRALYRLTRWGADIMDGEAWVGISAHEENLLRALLRARAEIRRLKARAEPHQCARGEDYDN